MIETFDRQKYSCRNPIVRVLIKNFCKNLIKLIEMTDAKRIVDAGCGEGHLLNSLCEYQFFKRKDVYIEGFDCDERLLEFARRINPKIKFFVQDLYNLSLNIKDYYDLVLCTEVLEHMRRPHEVIVALRQLSKKWCIFSVPNEPLFSISNLLRGRYIKRLGNKPGHINMWSANQFARMLEGYFRIKKLVKPFPWVIALCQKP